MKKAFTLSEVLVTLGIIGVVASLTIPTIVKNYRYKVYGSQIQKVYSQLDGAMKTIMVDEMTDDFTKTTANVPNDATNCTKGACYFLSKYFKLARTNCGTGTKKCIADHYITSSGVNAGAVTSGFYCSQTVNGAAICINHNSANHISTIFIDTNGEDAPNTVGLDAFIMNFSNNQLEDWGNDPTKCGQKVTSYSHVGDYLHGCLTKVMQNGWVVKD